MNRIEATLSPTPDLRQARTEIFTLQFTRGLAAMVVVLVHLAERLVKRGLLADNPNAAIWNLGYLGVATFFAISGFIMVHTTWDRFGQPNAAPRFMLRRFLRIAPLYYLTTVFGIALHYVTNAYSTNGAYVPPSIAEIVKSILFVPYIDEAGLIMPVYKLGWTLEYEMLFYLLFAGALLLRRTHGLAVLLATLLALVVTGTLMDPRQGASTLQVLAWFTTRPILLNFMCGMILAVIYRRYGPFGRDIPSPAVAALGASTFLVACTTNVVPNVILAASAVAVTGLVMQQQRGSAFAALCRVFGDTSYSVYLTHTFLLGAVALLATKVPVERTQAVLLAVVVAVGVSFGTGWLVWRFIEIPIAVTLRTLNFKHDKERTPAP